MKEDSDSLVIQPVSAIFCVWKSGKKNEEGKMVSENLTFTECLHLLIIYTL